eukprot:3180274-Prorocentrum_lima.AAC.1
MTSSLVGSEMCIRDSLEEEAAVNHCNWATVLSSGTSTKASSPNRASRSPVSYTHLTLPTICSV